MGGRDTTGEGESSALRSHQFLAAPLSHRGHPHLGARFLALGIPMHTSGSACYAAVCCAARARLCACSGTGYDTSVFAGGMPLNLRPCTRATASQSRCSCGRTGAAPPRLGAATRGSGTRRSATLRRSWLLWSVCFPRASPSGARRGKRRSKKLRHLLGSGL